MLQILWNTFAYSGVALTPDPSEHKHIILVNGLSFVISAFTLLNIPIMYVLGAPSYLFALSCFFAVAILFTIRINGKGKTSAARVYFAIAAFLYLASNSVILGLAANFHFFLITECVVLFFIFPARERKLMYSLSVAVFAFFIASQFYARMHEPFVKINPAMADLQRISIDVGVGFLFCALAFYIKNTFLTAERQVQVEQEKSERLLLNILPSSVIAKLRHSPDTIAERFEHCTVLFSDIVGFTELSKRLSAVEVVEVLNQIFSAFDDLAEKHGLEKIKTIGDSYMVVGGLPEPDGTHAEKIALFALEMLEIVREFRKNNDLALELRIGINSGDAVAGVIGKKKFIYDLWGDSVNTASRMESYGIPGQIQVTESTYSLLKHQFDLQERGAIDVKGLGSVKTYWLLSGPRIVTA